MAGAATVAVAAACVDVTMTPPPARKLMDQLGLAVVIPIVGLMIAVPRVIKSYNLCPWAKTALWIAGTAGMLWCAVGFLAEQLRVPLLASQAKWYLADRLWMLVAGFFVGVSVTLFLSGALSKKHDDAA